ncbi:MAG: hypothetical protein K2N26_02090 [Oscillospiraceae bacterium]|nr:hypothetical protein [Oscillospiraceae bacterium]MDE7278499.1 hypothetical protein [Oscillospiraceae bacterium]
MDIKKFFKNNGYGIICMAICFAAGFVLGALLAPHHNRLEFNLFSGNGNGNRDNSANFGSGGVQNGQKRRKKAQT